MLNDCKTSSYFEESIVTHQVVLLSYHILSFFSFWIKTRRYSSLRDLYLDYAQFWNPIITPSWRKESVRKNVVYSGHLLSWQCMQTGWTKNLHFVQKNYFDHKTNHNVALLLADRILNYPLHTMWMTTTKRPITQLNLSSYEIYKYTNCWTA